MPDPHVAAQLSVSRTRWAERQTDTNWHEWVARTARNAFRGRAPTMTSLRIHSLPGCLWEVLNDAAGNHCLVADDELTATLAELRLLGMPGATPDMGYDKCVLMLADAFRSTGDTHHYAVCMGWAIPRRAEIQRLRHSAFTVAGNSAEAMIVLLHEVAHRVLKRDDGSLDTWREACTVGVSKVLDGLSSGEHLNKALAAGTSLGLELAEAERQIQVYLGHVRANTGLLEELTCDLLAIMAFLNLNSSADVLDDPDGGPSGMSIKEVGDALLVAHGAIQNMQLLAVMESIAASASATPDTRMTGPDRTGAELTARSTVMVFLLSNLLQDWCEQGQLRAKWPGAVPNAKDSLLRAIETRNRIRAANILDPLQDLDGIFHDEGRYSHFEQLALQHLREASIPWPGSRKALDATRWSMTLAGTPG